MCMCMRERERDTQPTPPVSMHVAMAEIGLIPLIAYTLFFNLFIYIYDSIYIYIYIYIYVFVLKLLKIMLSQLPAYGFELLSAENMDRLCKEIERQKALLTINKKRYS